MSNYQSKYYAKTYYDRSGNTYSKNPRYSKLFSMAMHKYGYDFAQWYMLKVFERQKAAFYDVDKAYSDWKKGY